MKKCWIPLSYSQSDTEAMSELFESFAQKGWHFYRLNSSSAVFIKGEKQRITYTVDLFSQPRNNHDDERVSEYRDLCAYSGWEYVDGYNEFQVFKAIQDDPVPLQSDDELASEIIYAQQIRKIKSNIMNTLLLIGLEIMAVMMSPLDLLIDDMFLTLLIIVPSFGLINILWQGYRYIKIKKMNKYSEDIKGVKKHLLAKSILSLIAVVLFFGSIILYVGIKFLHHESTHNSIYSVIAFVNMLFVLHYQKRNEGRKLKTWKIIKLFALSFIGCSIIVGGLSDILPKLPVDQHRVIRMNDPTASGTFTQYSSIFVPYQCEFLSASDGYRYSLYIAKDLKTSELVYKALLAQNKISKNDELEPVNERYAVEGFYLNDNHSKLLFHIDNCVIFINGNDDELINISRFNEQLSELNLSY